MFYYKGLNRAFNRNDFYFLQGDLRYQLVHRSEPLPRLPPGLASCQRFRIAKLVRRIELLPRKNRHCGSGVVLSSDPRVSASAELSADELQKQIRLSSARPEPGIESNDN